MPLTPNVPTSPGPPSLLYSLVTPRLTPCSSLTLVYIHLPDPLLVETSWLWILYHSKLIPSPFSLVALLPWQPTPSPSPYNLLYNFCLYSSLAQLQGWIFFHSVFFLPLAFPTLALFWEKSALIRGVSMDFGLFPSTTLQNAIFIPATWSLA